MEVKRDAWLGLVWLAYVNKHIDSKGYNKKNIDSK